MTAIKTKGSPLSAKPLELEDGSFCTFFCVVFFFPLSVGCSKCFLFLFYSDFISYFTERSECLPFRGECLPGETSSNILLSISNFMLLSPRLTCGLRSKSCPTSVLFSDPVSHAPVKYQMPTGCLAQSMDIELILYFQWFLSPCSLPFAL